MKITKYLCLLFSILLALACKKQEVLNADTKKVVNLEIKGYIMTTDTLEFIDKKDSLICLAIGSTFTMKSTLFNPEAAIKIRKGKTIIGEFKIAESPYKQVKRILFDGTSISDNIQITPVSDPAKAGIRLSFNAVVDFGGKVDIELFDQYTDPETFITDNTSIRVFSNVSGVFGDFIELPILPEGHSYSFKVYKPGTQDLPYTDMTNVNISNPATNFGKLNLTAGESQLLSISPRVRNNKISTNYIVNDLSGVFQ